MQTGGDDEREKTTEVALVEKSEPSPLDPLGDEASPEEGIAGVVIPYGRDTSKARYLSYRACAFTTKEATRLVGIKMGTLSWWRTDDLQFAELESRIPEFQHTLSKEYADLEFVRNFRLVMEKDYKVISKSLGLTDDNSDELNPQELTKQEHDYLLKMRQYYTPQQFQIMAAIAGHGSGTSGGDGSGGNEINFTKVILNIAEMARRENVVYDATKE